MPVIVRRRLVNRWSIAFAAIVVLTIGTAAFAITGSLLGWLTRDQVSGIGGFLPFVTLIAGIYVVINWIETQGWSWARFEDDRCLDVAREFLARLTNDDFAGAFELTDPATFGEDQKGFAKWAAERIGRQEPIEIQETTPSENKGVVPSQYRFEGQPFALVLATYPESPDQVVYCPGLRLVLCDDRYLVQTIDTVVMGRPCEHQR